ncbi:oxygen-dependent tRNA uridine(34) hydroxylase TrhO [Dyadobacter sandarakinus]|uniref:tRNA uridine(34) hydroxylase n=1 Tax=Dyadobacter sandarakinus TaxID=2747268 RepID=A0ABX7ID28_9BACT|nr:rhodanese-related sulfurtransferase [Dyadobacter sandarakinus]QRR04022.1 rhodanese-related sulfurtransferase [Dyadobacter sandarakinus]
MKPYRVILYYCYSPIADPDAYRDEHHLFCVEHNLLGRIIVAPEGLNGTVSGTVEDCEAYMEYVRSDERFSSVQFKIEEHDTIAFQKLHVRVKDEIVNSDLHVNPLVRTGKHLEPSEFRKLINDPDVVLVDMRSDYEHEVGKFKGAITFDMHNLRELPDHVHEIEHLKDKKIVTYCTGGIKCEKASAYLLEQGFTDVYQLHGGIIRYGLEEGGENFDGKCYVFDNRITVDVNKVNPTVISTCYICHTACDRMVNCANPECNNHVPICEACAEQMEGACTEECKSHPAKRVYNGTGYYVAQSNHYHPMQGLKSQKKTIKHLKLAAQNTGTV